MNGPLFFEVYRDGDGRYRWRVRYGERILAESSEAYEDKKKCTAVLKFVWSRAACAPLVDATRGLDPPGVD
jgi:uncharacterized protein YegP (UPF0339 family)